MRKAGRRGRGRGTGPPRFAQLLLALSLAPRYRDQQLGDLAEEFAARTRESGYQAARRWYWRQVMSSVPPNLRLRIPPSKKNELPRSASMETLFQDLRYGIRALRRSPAFATISIVTLALAIGVNSAIFSLVNVVINADLPMQNPETVALFRATNAKLGVETGPFSFPEYLDFVEQSRSFEAIAGWREDRWILTGGDEPLRVTGYRTTANFLDVWRVATVVGRGFLPGEDVPGAPHVAILSHGFWTRHFAGRRDVIGSTLRLDEEEYEVIGVVSPEMEFANLADVEIWVPMGLDRQNAARDERSMGVTGRLRPALTIEQAQQDIAAIGTALAEEYPAINEGWETRVLAAPDALLNDESRTILLLLALTVGFVLLIACANVANMLLARASSRSREMAVRAALGARRTRVVRQLLTESAVIALVAAAIGLVFSRGLMQSLIWITKGQQDIFLLAELDGHVVVFTLLISLAAPLLFGTLPAIRASAVDLSDTLKEGSQRAGGRRKSLRIRGFLVVAQVSLALMSMVVSGLLVRTVVKQVQLELGFDPAGVLSLQIDVPETKYDSDTKVRQFFQLATARLSGLPAVEAVALVSRRPATSPGPHRQFEIAGRPAAQESDRPTAHTAVATPGFVDLMRIPLLRGRDFVASDRAEAVPVALISLETSRKYWPGQDPLGSRIRISNAAEAAWLEIVGVVGNVRNQSDSESADPQIYLPFAQKPNTNMVVMVRTSGDPASLAAPVRNAVWTIDPNQPIDDVRTMERVQYDASSSGLALITLFAAFALFALCMAAIGIYGVMSYAISQRTSEISIRLALGADASQVQRMVLVQGGRLIAMGTAVGLVGAYFVRQLLSSIVFGISTLDPVTFIGVPAILASVGLLANYIPARRATRIDPMTVLRTE